MTSSALEPGDVFDDFDKKAVAAASIAQDWLWVYR